MATPILTTKLYLPPRRPNAVLRPRLIEAWEKVLSHKLTLVSAPAGFGKTTLVSEWLAGFGYPVAWLSLDVGDNEPNRFLQYFIAALQKVDPSLGQGLLTQLASSQTAPTEAMLTSLLNDIACSSNNFVVTLDDYHVIDSKPVDTMVGFLLEYLPSQMHLVIITREDPQLSLSRLRARNQLIELRASDLRFTSDETAEFLNRVMNLNLSAHDITTLEQRTEGWIVGLQLAALSLQGHHDASSFIRSFTGGHHFVLDYLLEEVLQQQPEIIQTFLLHTSILERLCGSLCAAVLQSDTSSGQAMLESLERANLFLIPLDDERRWYRYHHLFADLLRRKLHANNPPPSNVVDELHLRASHWYEENELEVDAFHHAAAGQDIDRATRLIDGKGMPLYYRGAVTPVLNWLASLQKAVFDSNPLLWVMYASVLSVTGRSDQVEDKLQAAEAVFEKQEHHNETTRDLIGQIAVLRAMSAAPTYNIDVILGHSRRALEYLLPEHLSVRTTANCMLGFAYQLQGDRTRASQAYLEAIRVGQASGNTFITMVALASLGLMQEADYQLYKAAETYQRFLHLAGDLPLPVACVATLGLARIFYEWNDLVAAEKNGQTALELARQLQSIDTFAECCLFLTRLSLTQGNVSNAVAHVNEAKRFVHQHNFPLELPIVFATEVRILITQENLVAAEQLAQIHKLPLSQARVQLALNNHSAALAVLEPLLSRLEFKAWENERLELLLLKAIAYQMQGDKNQALQLLQEALTLAEPGGFIRTLIDKGVPMEKLLSATSKQGVMPSYVAKLLAAFEAEKHKIAVLSSAPALGDQVLLEPLSERELEVLKLIAQGLSNRDISKRLFRALDTIKGHNRIIFDKLQVQNRTEAVARARELGLL
jgi:LuxR family transcriptional regulator, maltose regulon positive regulatory protein